MAGEIRLNQYQAVESAARIECAAVYFRNSQLVPQYTRTTIPANANGRAAYGRSQSCMEELGSALDQEVRNIRSLNAAFTEFDEMMGELAKTGSRHMTIRAAE